MLCKILLLNGGFVYSFFFTYTFLSTIITDILSTKEIFRNYVFISGRFLSYHETYSNWHHNQVLKYTIFYLHFKTYLGIYYCNTVILIVKYWS